MTDLQALLQEIDRLDQEATKGPWESLGHSVDSRTTYDEVVSTEVDCGTYCMGGTGKGVQDDSDAEFIVLARTALPSIARALQAVIESCEETIRSVDKNLLPDEGDHAKRHHADMILDAITDTLGDDNA